MDKFEKLVAEIMAEAEKDGEPVTRAEAEEMATMELGAKQIKRYEQAEKPRKKREKPKTVKTSDEKIALFNSILTNLDRCEGVERENITVVRENKLILVEINGKRFKIDLIETRQKK